MKKALYSIIVGSLLVSSSFASASASCEESCERLNSGHTLSTSGEVGREVTQCTHLYTANLLDGFPAIPTQKLSPESLIRFVQRILSSYVESAGKTKIVISKKDDELVSNLIQGMNSRLQSNEKVSVNAEFDELNRLAHALNPKALSFFEKLFESGKLFNQREETLCQMERALFYRVVNSIVTEEFNNKSHDLIKYKRFCIFLGNIGPNQQYLFNFINNLINFVYNTDKGIHYFAVENTDQEIKNLYKTFARKLIVVLHEHYNLSIQTLAQMFGFTQANVYRELNKENPTYLNLTVLREPRPDETVGSLLKLSVFEANELKHILAATIAADGAFLPKPPKVPLFPTVVVGNDLKEAIKRNYTALLTAGISSNQLDKVLNGDFSPTTVSFKRLITILKRSEELAKKSHPHQAITTYTVKASDTLRNTILLCSNLLLKRQITQGEIDKVLNESFSPESDEYTKIITSLLKLGLYSAR